MTGEGGGGAPGARGAAADRGAPGKDAAPSVKARLYAPGPVEVPPPVLAAMARPVTHHRAPAFRELLLRVRGQLAEVFLVPGDDVLVLTGSGTAGFEAALLACVPQGAPVLALHAGKFGQRWANMARRFGYDVHEVPAPAGADVDMAALAEALARTPDVAAVTVVHSETSTGALTDVRAVAAAVRAAHPDALVVVDAVTSLAAAELRPREWDLDVVVSGSQKGVMAPPGLAFAWLSERAWARGDGLPPSYYLDLRRERAKQREGQNAFTPAVTLVAGLEVALDMILERGVEAVWRERGQWNAALLAAGAAIGLERFARRPSPAVAAMTTPAGVEAPALVRHLRERGITIGGGQDELKPRLVRPSLLGWADRYDVVVLAAALEDAMRAVGAPPTRGSAVAAAMEALDE